MIDHCLVACGQVVARRGAAVPVPWWSVTKTVLAAAALALVRDGRLALDRPCPGFPFSLRQLLRHEAGLADYGEYAAYHAAVATGEAPWSTEELLARLDAARLRYPPGKGWGYSNVGYLHVRRLIEETAGTPLGSALERLVLAPLDISHTRVAAAPEDLAGVAGVAPGYHPGWVYHGLLVGPLTDAALFLDRLLEGRLLPDDLLRTMREPLALGGSIPGRPWLSPGYGLGIMTGQAVGGVRLTGHTGGGPGSVVAVYRVEAAGAPRTAAACRTGDDAGAVERSVIALAAPTGHGGSMRA